MTATVKLPPGADELLQAFPADEPDFEAQAKAIEARLLDKAAAAGGDELFGPPELAAEPGEPAAASRVRAAAAPKSNFAEMARKSLHQKEDDGAQLARELLAATAQSRRPSAEMVERVRAAGRQAAASATPLPVASSEAQRPSGVVALADLPAPARAEQPASAPTTSRGTIIGVAGAALALAACFALFMRSESSESATTAALARERAAQESAAPIAAKPSTLNAPAATSDGVTTPEALAAAPASEGAAAKRAGALKPNAGAVGPSAVAATKAPASPQAQQQPAAVVLEEEAQPEPAAEAKAKPEPAPEPALRPAEGSADGVPLTPSAGAVSTALSSVRASAQACLAGQNDPVSALVTFASDGHVLRVSAGGPSGACIQAALSKARIQPFARDSFSATATIRPP